MKIQTVLLLIGTALATASYNKGMNTKMTLPIHLIPTNQTPPEKTSEVGNVFKKRCVGFDSKDSKKYVYNE
ncbi:hypothetical protein Vi05172_g8513 [Venturia inaequalis]|nr:hypothetical protein Vi05172_g8513 [Venturia inaequalis]